ncbi:MAG: methylated-DNA--[protein]-cysteine S-methyltransferase [Solitalea-like symbiont of Tyrophagus putrescentiae]
MEANILKTFLITYNSSIKTYIYNYSSPIGNLEIELTEKAIKTVKFATDIKYSKNIKCASHPFILEECIRQLDMYFAGKLKCFSLNLDINGTTFQEKVWEALLQIPFGSTSTYAEIARNINIDKAHRAVGLANNKNQFHIIVPCHRVISSSGRLSGYAAGTTKKQWLINHEQNIINNNDRF